MKVVPFIYRAILIAVVLIFSGCGGFLASLHRGPIDRESTRIAERLIDDILNAQNSPDTFKGIGKIKIEQENRLQSGRMAWIGSLPAKLRIQLLSFAGQSAATLSSDGEYLYIIDHGQRRFYKRKLSGTDLKRVLSIPLPPDDIADILAGRTPVIDYTFATVDQTIDSGPVLILEKGFWAEYEKIYFDEQMERVIAAEFYRSDGDLKYRVVFEKLRTLKGYRVPVRIVLTDGRNTEIILDVERYWVDAAVLPTAFVLTPPEPETKDF